MPSTVARRAALQNSDAPSLSSSAPEKLAGDEMARGGTRKICTVVGRSRLGFKHAAALGLHARACPCKLHGSTAARAAPPPPVMVC